MPCLPFIPIEIKMTYVPVVYVCDMLRRVHVCAIKPALPLHMHTLTSFSATLSLTVTGARLERFF